MAGSKLAENQRVAETACRQRGARGFSKALTASCLRASAKSAVAATATAAATAASITAAVATVASATAAVTETAVDAEWEGVEEGAAEPAEAADVVQQERREDQR